jgi:hypothetical protein
MQQAKSSKYAALAEMVKTYQTQTPPRYHSKPLDKDVFQPQPFVQPKLTQPITPVLETERRAALHNALHPVCAPQEVNHYVPFKATEINRKIFDGQGDYGVPRVEKKPLTEPVAFTFRTDKLHPIIAEQEVRVRPFSLSCCISSYSMLLHVRRPSRFLCSRPILCLHISSRVPQASPSEQSCLSPFHSRP